MSTQLTVEIKGLKELQNSFKKSPDLAVKVFDKAIKRSIFVLLAATRPWVPVDTGFLRETGMQTTFEALVGRLENTAPYAVYVHEGTRKMDARPFFDRGIKDSEEEVNAIINDAMDEFMNNL